MRIRQLENNDADAYCELREELDGQSPYWGVYAGERAELGWTLSQVGRVLKDERSAIFLAESGEDIIGFLSLETPPWQSLRRTTTLMIGVLESFQGKGIARCLFDEAEAWAQSVGIHRIELLVYTENAAAVSLYERRGYAREGIRKDSSFFKDRYWDELFMAKVFEG